MAGYGEVFRPVDFIGYRILFLLLALFFLLLGMTSGNVGLCLLLAVLLAFYPGLWLRAVIRARQLSIMKALPNVLDLLTLSVESGRDLLSSLHDILSRRRPDPLGEELMRTFREIQLGRKRTEALRALSNRVRQTDLTAVVNAIIQARSSASASPSCCGFRGICCGTNGLRWPRKWPTRRRSKSFFRWWSAFFRRCSGFC